MQPFRRTGIGPSGGDKSSELASILEETLPKQEIMRSKGNGRDKEGEEDMVQSLLFP